MSNKSTKITSNNTVPCRTILLIKKCLKDSVMGIVKRKYLNMLGDIFFFWICIKCCCCNIHCIISHFPMYTMIIHYIHRVSKQERQWITNTYYHRSSFHQFLLHQMLLMSFMIILLLHHTTRKITDSLPTTRAVVDGERVVCPCDMETEMLENRISILENLVYGSQPPQPSQYNGLYVNEYQKDIQQRFPPRCNSSLSLALDIMKFLWKLRV